MFLSLFSGLTLKDVKAGFTKTFAGHTGYMWLKVEDDWGNEEKIKINTYTSNGINDDEHRTLTLSYEKAGSNTGSGFNVFRLQTSGNIADTQVSGPSKVKPGNGHNFRIIRIPFSMSIPQGSYMTVSYNSDVSATNCDDVTIDSTCAPGKRLCLYEKITWDSSDRSTTYHGLGSPIYFDGTTKTYCLGVHCFNLFWDPDSGASYHPTITLHVHRSNYAINWNYDGGNKSVCNDSTKIWTYPSAIKDDVDFCAPAPTKTGYKFKGWSVTAHSSNNGYTYINKRPENGSWSTMFNANSNTLNATLGNSSWHIGVENLSGNLDFVANWDPIQYTLRYNSNFPERNPINHANDYTLKYDQDTTVLPLIEGWEPQNQAWDFLGWSEDKNATEADPKFKPGVSIRNLESTQGARHDLYAVWKKDPTMLGQPNPLLNPPKRLELVLTKELADITRGDPANIFNATFDVFEWSTSQGKYKDTAVATVNAHQRVYLNFTPDNAGKFKLKEKSATAGMNVGQELIVSLNSKDMHGNDKMVQLPFYENTMTELDMGVYVKGRGYLSGEVVRDVADGSKAKFYIAQRTVTNEDLNGNQIELSDTRYWKRLDEVNPSLLNKVKAGLGEWKEDSYSYAVAFSFQVVNPTPTNDSLGFAIRKKNTSGETLSGATFNVYYTDGTLCRNMPFVQGNSRDSSYRSTYSMLHNNSTDKVDWRNLSIDTADQHWVKQNGLPEGSPETKVITLLVKEDKAPDGYKKIKDFYVRATATYNEAGSAWNVNSVIAYPEISGGTAYQSISNGGVFDFEELEDEAYPLTINVNKKDAKDWYDVSKLDGAVFGIFADEGLTQPVTSDINGKAISLVIKNGKATVKNLPLKDYWVKEMSEPTSGLYEISDEVQKISKEDLLKGNPDGTSFNATLNYEDNPIGGYLKVFKQDKEGTPIPGAKFSIYPVDTDVDAKTFDNTDKTATATAEVKKDGYATFEEVPIGKYVLVETTVPDGWKKADNQLVEITKDNMEEAGANTVSVIESPDVPLVKIIKTDKETGKKLEGATFNIFDITDNKYITTGSVSVNGSDIESSTSKKNYSTEEDGTVFTTLGDLQYGHKIRIEEVISPDGYVLNTEPIELTLTKGKEDGVDEYGFGYFEVSFQDAPTSFKFSKADITTKEEITGGKYQVLDEDENLIDEWENKGTPHTVKNLVANQKYIYREVGLPEGYIESSDVYFYINEDGTKLYKQDNLDEDGNPVLEDKLVMYDDYTKISLTKVDITTGRVLDGAVMELYAGSIPENMTLEDWKKNKKPLYSWTTTTEPYVIERLPFGTYTWVEVSPPKGYLVGPPKEIDVEESGDVQEYSFEDDYTKTVFQKYSGIDGKPLKDCTLQVLDKNKDVVYSPTGEKQEWVTDGEPHEVDYLIAGETYYLHEVSSPTNFYLSEDVEFVAGQPWTETIEVTPDGEPDPDRELVNDGGTEPEKVRIAMQVGDVFSIVEKETGIVKDTWTYTGAVHTTTALEDGVTYILKNTKPATGYPAIEDVEFVAGESWRYNDKIIIGNPDDSEEVEDLEFGDEEIPEANVVNVYMTNQPKWISIVKKDVEPEESYYSESRGNRYLDGADLQLKDSKGNVLDSWTSNSKVSKVYNLENGTYYIHETYAPGIWDITPDVEFVVDDNTKVVEYEMIDDYIKGTLKIKKTDEKTNQPLEGVEYTLKGELVNGKKVTITGKTNKDGELVLGLDEKTGKGTLIAGKYTITESSVDGHTLLKDPIEVTLPLDLTEAEAEAKGADTSKAKWDRDEKLYRFFDLSFDISNDVVLELPATGSNVGLYAVIGGAIVFLLIGIYIIIRRRRAKLD